MEELVQGDAPQSALRVKLTQALSEWQALKLAIVDNISKISASHDKASVSSTSPGYG